MKNVKKLFLIISLITLTLCLNIEFLYSTKNGVFDIKQNSRVVTGNVTISDGEPLPGRALVITDTTLAHMGYGNTRPFAP